MNSLFSTEIFGDDFVSGSVWFPFEPDQYSESLQQLIPQKNMTPFGYLGMLKKLFPFGEAWNFPLGEEGDY